jgi:predicted permease
MGQDLRHALRLFRKNPGFSAVAAFVLALGIGANTAIFTLVNALLFRPLAGGDEGQLVGVYSRDKNRADGYRSFSYADYRDLREGNDAFDSLAAQSFGMAGLGEGDTTRRLFAAIVSSNYFSTLGVRPARGRAFTEEEEAPGKEIPVAIVSHGLWRRLGAGPHIGDTTIRLNGRDFTVVGVAPEGFTGTTALFSPEVWLPLGVYHLVPNLRRPGDLPRLEDRQQRNLVLVGRLKRGLTAAQADARLQAANSRLIEASPADNRDQLLSLAPLPRLAITSRPQSNAVAASTSGLLMAMTGVVLLVACLNLANMLLARGEARRKEIAVRQALGASRGRIVRQLLAEGFVLSLAGGAAGLLLAYWATWLLASSILPLPIAIVLPADPDARVLGATLGFCVLATTLFGLGPAWKVSRFDVLPDLKEHAGDQAVAPGGRRLLAPQNLLVTGQIALSLALLVTGGLFVRGALKAAAADPGFRLERGLLLEIDPSFAGYDGTRGRIAYRAVLDRLRSLPGVESVSLASTVPFGQLTRERRVRKAGEAELTGKEPSGVPAQHVVIAADYFRTLGLSILRGRDFERSEEFLAEGRRPAIVDEPLARKLWPGEDPLGRQIQFPAGPDGSSEPLEVVGVVPGLRHGLFDPGPVPHVYVPFAHDYQPGMNLHVRVSSTDPAAERAMLATVREQVRAVDARLPVVSASTLRDFREGTLLLWMVRTGARLFTSFGLVALLLAVVGVYGVKAYVVARRTREIGIRVALGARPADVVRLILREGLLLTAAGIGAGLVLALMSGKVVSSLLYQVSATDPVVFAVAPAVLAASALLAAYLPARRATRITPAMALRAE